MSDDASTVDRVKGIMKKFLSPNSKPTFKTFPELVECIVWLRFVLAVFFGIYAGTTSRSGGGGNILVALNFIAFPPIVYCQSFLAADQESYGTKLYFSGIPQALALAMLIWIYFYTESHAQDEAAFVSAFSKLLADVEEAVSPVIGDDTGIPLESEF
jgi:hypothetical protein